MRFHGLGRLSMASRLTALPVVALLGLSLSHSQVSPGAAQEPSDVSAAPGAERGQSRFQASLPAAFSLPVPDDTVGWRLLAEYGAVLVARGGAVPPPVLVFTVEEEVNRWQASAETRRVKIGRFTIELQTPAMEALLAARAEARQRGLSITPADRDAGRRTYAQTVELWKSRVHPGLDYWVRKGRLATEEAARIRALAPHEQVPEVLRLEKQGMNFGSTVAKSILFSVAAPGASQHLAMLAFDVRQHRRRSVRRILAHHGWFQTVESDLPHFTYLGVNEEELPSLGLKRVARHGRAFWVPDLQGVEVRSQTPPE